MESREVLLNKLGKRIQQVRKEKGISQEKLAHLIGKDQQSIQRLESGQANPTFYFLTEVAEGLNVDVARLVSKD